MSALQSYGMIDEDVIAIVLIIFSVAHTEKKKNRTKNQRAESE